MIICSQNDIVDYHTLVKLDKHVQKARKYIEFYEILKKARVNEIGILEHYEDLKLCLGHNFAYP